MWQKGDEKAFDSIYKRYVVYLTNIALQKLNSFDAAKNCVQEVFLSLFLRKSSLETTSNLKSYLYKALENKIYNYYYKEITRLKHESASFENSMHSNSHVLEKLESKELYQIIKEKIDSLPPQCKKVFKMSREENLSYKEISASLNISINTVDQHIQKALKVLRYAIRELLFLIIYIKLFF